MADITHSPRGRDVLRRGRSIDARQERAGRSADSALTAGLMLTIRRQDQELAELRALIGSLQHQQVTA